MGKTLLEAAPLKKYRSLWKKLSLIVTDCDGLDRVGGFYRIEVSD